MDTTPGKNAEFERAEAILWEAIDTAYQAGVYDGQRDTQRAAASSQRVVNELLPRYRETLSTICSVDVDAHDIPTGLKLAEVGAGTSRSP